MHAARLIRVGINYNTGHRHRLKFRVSVAAARISHDPIAERLRRRTSPLLPALLLEMVCVLDGHLKLYVLDHGVLPVLERRLVMDGRRGVRRQYLLEDLLGGGGFVDDGPGEGGGVRR